MHEKGKHQKMFLLSSGTSTKNMLHWFQLIQSHLLTKYDYGKKGNMEHYGQNTPPEYDISKLHTPVALISGMIHKKFWHHQKLGENRHFNSVKIHKN